MSVDKTASVVYRNRKTFSRLWASIFQEGRMKKLLSVAVFFFAASGPACAQAQVSVPPRNENVAMDFSCTSAANFTATSSRNSSRVFVASSRLPDSLACVSLEPLPSPSASASLAYPPAAEPPTPATPFPRYDPTERYQRWTIGLGFAFLRFRSSVYNASAIGLNSSLAYSVKDWLAIEGAVTSAFAPTIYRNEHIKYVGYGAGPKISLTRDQFEPWVHVLVGGVHILPQTAFSGQNGFEVLAGGGVDYNITSQFAARLEADWVNTHVFGQSQNNGQASLGVVFRF